MGTEPSGGDWTIGTYNLVGKDFVAGWHSTLLPPEAYLDPAVRRSISGLIPQKSTRRSGRQLFKLELRDDTCGDRGKSRDT
jgi:hypothetical protein